MKQWQLHSWGQLLSTLPLEEKPLAQWDPWFIKIFLNAHLGSLMIWLSEHLMVFIRRQRPFNLSDKIGRPIEGLQTLSEFDFRWWKQTTAADWIVWITHEDGRSKRSVLRSTGIKLLLKPVPSRSLPLAPRSIITPEMATHPPFTLGTKNNVSDIEAITAGWTCHHHWQKAVCVPRNLEGWGHIFRWDRELTAYSEGLPLMEKGDFPM